VRNGIRRVVAGTLEGNLAFTTELMALERIGVQTQLGAEADRLRDEVRARTPANPACYGFKVYSQFDEDGIIAHITAKLDIAKGTFVEIGCADGTENNSHYLLLQGWSGVWIDNDEIALTRARAALPAAPSRLYIHQARITRENVVGEVEFGRSSSGHKGPVDLISVDIDGNDLAVTVPLAKKLAPKVLVVEYNAKFPWPLSVAIPYDAARTWAGDDAQGASLGAWTSALDGSYRLVACGLSGVNAFFVRTDLAGVFEEVSPAALYQPARYHLVSLESGHRPTLAFLAEEMRGDAAQGS
jgi:hypothetical protein